MQVAHWYGIDQRVELTPVSNPPTITWTPKLVFSPGYYQYNNLTYDLTTPGLYRLYNAMVNTTHMIVYDGQDIVSLLAGLAWLTVFGKGDASLNFTDRTFWVKNKMDKLRTSKISMLCTDTCTLIKQGVLDPLNITSRLVHFLTLGTPNNFVDGHVTLEVSINGSRTLVDIHNNCLFQGMSGKDVPAALLDGTVRRQWLSSEGVAVEEALRYDMDTTGYADAYLGNRTDIAAWQQRIFQAVGIDRPNGDTWYMLPGSATAAQVSWVQKLSPTYKVVDAASWLSAFYP